MTTEEKLLAGLGVILKALAPQQWDNFLVATGQSYPKAPTVVETAKNPGKFYGTQWDTLLGVVPLSVVEVFLPPTEDSEGNKIYKFTGGPLYAWAKADLESFLRYYEARYRVPLNMLELHPEQRAKMGLNG